jgi:hypothetical protein
MKYYIAVIGGRYWRAEGGALIIMRGEPGEAGGTRVALIERTDGALRRPKSEAPDPAQESFANTVVSLLNHSGALLAADDS